MVMLRILGNGAIIAAEISAVVAVAAFAFFHPFVFAAATTGLSFILGMQLEVSRLRYELPFYFGAGVPRSLFLTGCVGFVEAAFKAVVAGVATLFTFSGTNADRLFWVAVLFGVCVYAGANLLRYISIKAEALPIRWGYFRLAPLLGLAFSAGMALLAAAGVLPQQSVTGLGWKIIFETPQNPSVEQVSELLFQLKQAFEQFIVSVLSQVMSTDWSRLIAIVVSVNVLSGFVSAVYAALIASGVRRAERMLPQD